MQSLLLPIVAQLPQLLGTSARNATWVTTATLLAAAVSTPITGRLGDLYGKRRLMMTCLVLMTAGSVLAAVTSSLVPMVVARALQGMAIGAVPLGIGIMRDTLPVHRLPSATGMMSSSVGVGGALCLPGAAFLAQHADWHALFMATALLGALSALLVMAVVPRTPADTDGRFDVPGALALSMALVCLLLAVVNGSAWGWTGAATLGLLLGAGILLAGFVALELHRADPLVDLRACVRRPVMLANIAAVGVGVAYYALSLALPQLMQLPTGTGYGLGASLVLAGLVMAPLGLAMMAVSPLAARLTARRGPRATLLGGLALTGLGCVAGTVLLGHLWQIMIMVTVVGAGIGMAYSAMPGMIMNAVDAAETGAANGLNTMLRFVGTSLSSAVVGTVLAQLTRTHDGIPVPTLPGFRSALLIGAAAIALVLAAAPFLAARKR
ncbi:transporter [Streptomyces sp. CB02923]|uniref:MFS transporter n=1 Tax=Streptomyces sp. CB02923 TaxID=1718985 RepID=UPI00093A9576|nr:transporter [Streptomyces sp. CB02923]